MAGGGVTQSSSDRLHATTVSRAVVRAILDEAAGSGYGPGADDNSSVVGIFGDPIAIEAAEFSHAGSAVTVAPCVSALAVREALLRHDDGSWLVVVTDRPEEDLGSGVLAHFAGHKLRTPKPWEAVRQQFSATGLEPALYADPAGRSLAHGLLLARPESGWPPAPAGALTRDHALGAAAQAHLGLRSRSLDLLGVLQWMVTPDLTSRIAQLRTLGGDEITDATLGWICARAGAAAPLLTELVRRGEVRSAVPLGLVVGLLADVDATADAGPDGRLGLARLAHRWGGAIPDNDTLVALGQSAGQVVSTMLRDRADRPAARSILTAADDLLVDADATHLAAYSSLLQRGLTERLRSVAGQLKAALAEEPDAAVETAWEQVSAHVLADRDHVDTPDPRLRPVLAAVRLLRWLDVPDSGGDSLAELAIRQARVDAWVDDAVNDAYLGAADPDVAEALGAVLRAVQERRDAHDRAFATALADATERGDGTVEGFVSDGTDRVWLLEHLLPKVVMPLAKQTPVLFLVLDGMSTGVSTEIVEDILSRHDGWNEALLPGSAHRAAGLAVLPTLTDVSRASLFCGELTTGGQDREKKGYRALVTAHGLGPHEPIHKKPLDTTRAGYAVSDDVGAAIMDVEQRLVSCVLNTIDDALDRSDPAGTEWTADAVKHLRPLLDRALAAGRTVVLTADHGHVVERRAADSVQRSVPDMSSGRSRGAQPPPGGDEVLVTGTRVLKHGGSAVLPVTERLRYGPLKAGYHGGAAPAEVVVPLVVLVPGSDVPEDTDLTLAPPQEPAWWDRAAATDTAVTTLEVEAPVAPAKPSTRPKRLAQEGPDLFGDELITAEVTVPARPTRRVSLARAVLESTAYAGQRELSGRVSLSDEQVGVALESLASAPAARLPVDSLVAALSLPRSRAHGALAQLQSLLNVEGYPVLRVEGRVVVLDLPLLREQFGLSG